ncbi:MAG: glycosyltransferase family 2 protein [Candidatus Eisenbacteria bacterium]|nr:glycosyltransferase family 2 protein [Candidatus Eisenbacteria bacterium]
MKLVIQIPCLNEEATLPVTIRDLPAQLPGIDRIEILVIDDGSSDRTSEIAHQLGAARIVRFPARRGLARAFDTGLREALAMGADIIVNTDADNQYMGADIGKLITPILEKRADMVLGSRPIDSIEHFSPLKKTLQRLGSGVVRALSNTDVPDATSGFRAYSREAAVRLTVLTGFTYTLETLIQASQKNLTIAHVPIRVNGKLRESRLFKGMGSYISRSLGTMLRVYLLYQPLKFFLSLAGLSLLAAVALFARFLLIYARQPVDSGHVQSLIVAGALAVIGVLFVSLGVLSDLTAMNRRLLEEVVVNTRLTRLADERNARGGSGGAA